MEPAEAHPPHNTPGAPRRGPIIVVAVLSVIALIVATLLAASIGLPVAVIVGGWIAFAALIGVGILAS